MFKETPAHTAIFAAIKAKKKHLQISAVAGSGKTTTILKALDLVPSSESVLFLAFNKSIATEISTKLKRAGLSNAEAKTLHSVGMAAWRGHLKREGLISSPRELKVDNDKCFKLAREASEARGYVRPVSLSLANAAKRLVSYAKAAAVGVDVPGAPDDVWAEWEALIDHHGMRLPDDRYGVEQVIEVAREVYAASLQQLTVIDFDDMLLMPVAHKAKAYKHDRVFVDEAQDLSPLQHELLAKLCKRNGQLVAVGDPAQAIYGFRGADSRSMNTLRDRFNMERLPLSVTYRCAASIVRLAQAEVPHLEAAPGAPEGTVDLNVKAPDDVEMAAGDLVVSRTNAPAVRLCYALIAQRRKARILGREVGQGLVKLIKNLKPSSVDDLLDKAGRWYDSEVERLERRGAPESVRAALADKVECLHNLAADADTVDDVLDLIDTMFVGVSADDAVTICSVHKSKGLEADRVWILNPQLMPHPMAKKDWEKVQEGNLKYVAQTRAKSFLGHVAYAD